MTAVLQFEESESADADRADVTLDTSVDEPSVASELRRAQEHLRLWRAVFEQSAEGVMICDAEHRIVAVNAAFERLTGYPEIEVKDRTPGILRTNRHNRSFYRDFWQVIELDGSWSGEISNRRKDGKSYLEWLTIRAIYDQQRNPTHYVGIFSDLTERKAAEASARHRADYDALTELPNRVLLLRLLLQLTDAARKAGELIAVLHIDLDRLNDINESLGHDKGDLLVQIVARRIAATIRLSDIAARISANEFVVLVPAVPEVSTAGSLAQLIIDGIRSPIELSDQNVVVSASIGISIFPNDGVGAEELIRHAGAALSKIKRERPNAYEFYAPEMNAVMANQLRTENALRLALQRDELVLHYQPQIELSSGRIIGAEALVRWDRPGEGLLPPSSFIPLAEECGLIHALGQWVVTEVMRQIKEWDALGLAPLTIAVNISAPEFRQPGFADRIARELQLNAIDPSRLELELTEGIAVRDVALTCDTLKQLHELGVRLSLDDFGTGYSSLSYLRRFPFDKLKIDQSFIREMTDQPDSIRIVRAIIALAKSFGMTAIAEGVELPTQLAALRSEHCDEMQGYIASVPLSASDFVQLYKGWQGMP